jgi:thymidylate kinase
MIDTSKEQLFRDIMVSLDRAGHKLCVLHGDKDHSERYEIKKDVDIISEDPARVPRILSEGKVASIVRASKGAQDTLYSLYLYRRYDDRPAFLELDVWADCRRKGYVFFDGEELLETCRTFEYFNVLSPEFEFACYLVRRIIKGLDEARVQRLSELYREDPSECDVQLARLFPETEASLIAAGARSGDWEPVYRQIEHLQKLVFERARHEQPLGKLRFWLGEIKTRVRACVRPDGLMVAFLGTDGAGKSTVTARVERDLAPVFSSTRRYHRPVASARRWLKLSRTRPVSNAPAPASAPVAAADGQPGGPPPLSVPPRKLPASLLKLGLWWADYTILAYLLDTYPRLVRSTLVVLDRYYDDLLVYPESYRYGGPLWLARFVGRFIPRPHLVILLDAPPEVIQARKNELTFEETAYQQAAYVKLVDGLPNGHIVDASKPLDVVVRESEEIILGYMADRAAKHLGLRR